MNSKGGLIINNRLYKARAKVAKALAHHTRLAIVDILGEEGEKCVCELTEILNVSQSTVSKHLGVLKDAGIVNSKKEGLNVRYNLQTPCINNFFDCLDQILHKDLRKREAELTGKGE